MSSSDPIVIPITVGLVVRVALDIYYIYKLSDY